MAAYTHFIFKLVGTSPVQVKKAGEFRFVEAFRALIYDGRAIPLEEFNALAPRVMDRYNGYMPRLPQIVMLTAAEAAAATPAPRPVPAPVDPTPPDPGEPLNPEGVVQPEAPAAAEDADAPGEGSPEPEPEAEVIPPDIPAKKRGRPPKS